MAKVKQEFTGDASKLLAEYAKMREGMLKLEQGQKKLADASKRQADTVLSSHRTGTVAMQRMADGATGLARQYISAASALQLLNAETQRKNRLSQAALQANMTVGDAQAGVIKNIGDVSDEEIRKFLDEIANIQKKTGFQSQVPLLQAAASILSATGGNQKQTLDIVAASAPFFKDQQADLAPFGGALGDMMGVTGETNANRALALMLAIQGQARFEDLGAFKHVAPAMASSSVTQPGVDRTKAVEEAGAIFAGFGRTIGDADGAITKTAIANLAAKLQEVFPAEGLSMFDRLRMSWADPEAQAAVLKGSFDGAIRPTIEQLVRNPESEVSKAALAALEKIVVSEEMVARKREQLAGLTDPLGTATRTRQGQGNIERYDLGAGAAMAEARTILDQTMERVGRNVLENQMNMWRFDLAPDRTKIPLAKQMLLELQDYTMYGGLWHLGRKDPTKLTATEQEHMKLIGEQIRLLQQIEQNSRRQPPPSPTVHQEAR